MNNQITVIISSSDSFILRFFFLLRSFSQIVELVRAIALSSGGKNGDQPRDDVASQYRAIYFVIETTEEPNSARLPRSRPPRYQTCRYMPSAHDAIPIYLYLLTPQLPTYLPNYTEWSTSSDKRFTYRTARWIYRSAVCDVDILESRPSG